MTGGAACAAPPHLSSDKLLTPNRILTGFRGLELSHDEPTRGALPFEAQHYDGGIAQIAAFALVLEPELTLAAKERINQRIKQKKKLFSWNLQKGGLSLETK